MAFKLSPMVYPVEWSISEWYPDDMPYGEVKRQQREFRCKLEFHYLKEQIEKKDCKIKSYHERFAELKEEFGWE